MSATTIAGLDLESLAFTLESIDEFAERELPDAVLIDLDDRDEFPEGLVRKMCSEELGVQLLFVPEQYGGMGGSAVDVYRACERLAATDLGIATSVLATVLGSDPITVGGTPAQKALWLGRIAEEGILMAYGATEPDAGSDLAALKTTATPVLEDGVAVAYMLNGAKQWISNGGVADAATVLALAPGGPTWFVIDCDAPGLTRGEPEHKHGIRLSNTAALFLEDVRVPAERLVGGVEGQGLVQAQEVFGYTRLMVAAFGLGAGWAALDRAIPYSTERIQAGGPLSEKQGYTHKLIVPHAVRLEAARAAIEETAERIDAGGGALNTEGAIAKYLATEAGNARGRRRDPGARRLRLHARVHGREDQARRPHHDDLRGHLGDHGDDRRARPLAAAPEDAGRPLPRGGAGARGAARGPRRRSGRTSRRSHTTPSRLCSRPAAWGGSPATSTSCSVPAS